MEPSPIVPSIAVVINLSERVVERIEASCGLFRHLGVPATWVVDGPKQAKLLAEAQLATSELALTAEMDLPGRLGLPGGVSSRLSSRLAAVQALTGQEVSTVVGDPRQLRARAAMLSDLGIRAVIAGGEWGVAAKPPKQLSCGVWQLDPAVRASGRRRRWGVLPVRRTSLRQVLNLGTASETLLLEIAGGQMKQCERLLDEISRAVREQQLVVTTISQMVARLACEREVKPQRSILRVAA